MNDIHNWANLNGFEAYVGGFFGTSYHIKYDLIERSMTFHAFEQSLNELQGIDGSNLGIVEIDLMKREKLIGGSVERVLFDGLETYAILDWNAVYEMDCMDGTHWYVELQWADGSVTRKEGHNDYPAQWKSFCQLMKRISGKKFE